MPRVRNRVQRIDTRSSNGASHRVRAVSQDIRSGLSATTLSKLDYLNGGSPQNLNALLWTAIRVSVCGTWAQHRDPIPGIDGAVGWGMGA